MREGNSNPLQGSRRKLNYEQEKVQLFLSSPYSCIRVFLWTCTLQCLRNCSPVFASRAMDGALLLLLVCVSVHSRAAQEKDARTDSLSSPPSVAIKATKCSCTIFFIPAIFACAVKNLSHTKKGLFPSAPVCPALQEQDPIFHRLSFDDVFFHKFSFFRSASIVCQVFVQLFQVLLVSSRRYGMGRGIEEGGNRKRQPLLTSLPKMIDDVCGELVERLGSRLTTAGPAKTATER